MGARVGGGLTVLEVQQNVDLTAVIERLRPLRPGARRHADDQRPGFWPPRSRGISVIGAQCERRG